MEELKSLILKHRFVKNNFRTNLGGDIQTKYKRPMLVEAVYSNSIRNGPMIELVQSMLPDANITELCLNRNVVCVRHKDRGNNSTTSYIMFFGDYEGGELVVEEEEDRIMSEKEVWHSFDGKNCFHYNLHITNGTK